ncbi:MAG: zinc ribbon domain-containing protein [Clostridiales bacterium]|nr:zinc ribbon domain-containing protein [Clostridiales bacterium]
MGKFDGIFDDMVVNAKAAASAVSKKASEVYDSSKHKITASEIRNDINSKLRDLGAITYKAQTQNVDMSEQIAETVEQITELKDNLAAVNEHIAAAKNQRKCPNCDASVPKNSLFCNICGAKLELEDADGAEASADEADAAEDVIENTQAQEDTQAE